jgi:Cobalamin-independent synthase, Catalytic domain
VNGKAQLGEVAWPPVACNLRWDTAAWFGSLTFSAMTLKLINCSAPRGCCRLSVAICFAGFPRLVICRRKALKRSTDRILTTHVGSLVKPDELYDLTQVAADGHPYDTAAYEALLKSSIAEVVKKQAEVGIDVPNDGEFSKSSWAAYFAGRLTGAEVRPGQTAGGIHGIYARDLPDFPEWFNGARAGGGPSAQSYVLRASAAARGRRTVIQGAFCTGPLKYVVSRKLREILLTSRRLERAPALRSSA